MGRLRCFVLCCAGWLTAGGCTFDARGLSGGEGGATLAPQPGGPMADGPADASEPPDGPIIVEPSIVIRLNINGPAWMGMEYPGIWRADPGVGGACGPHIYSNNDPIHGTRDDGLFHGEVFGNPVQCHVGDGRLPNGRYQVALYFAEIYWGPGCPGGGSGIGSRLFDIVLEGKVVLANFDLFKVGRCAAATPVDPASHPVVRRFMIDIEDGTLDLSLPARADNGKISAIEIVGPR